jgi:hypothetical protein
MLTSLATVKTRLALDPLDSTYDALLLNTISAVSARFDQETHRTLARALNAQFEFPAEDTEILVPCFPIESVTRFERKTAENEGWLEQAGIDYLIRKNCIISLATAFADSPPANWNAQAAVIRVTYTGGYLLPGSEAVPGAASLPADLAQAAVEQVAFWFQTRDQLGVIRQWPRSGDYRQLADTDLLPSVRQTLRAYNRFPL